MICMRERDLHDTQHCAKDVKQPADRPQDGVRRTAWRAGRGPGRPRARRGSRAVRPASVLAASKAMTMAIPYGVTIPGNAMRNGDGAACGAAGSAGDGPYPSRTRRSATRSSTSPAASSATSVGTCHAGQQLHAQETAGEHRDGRDGDRPQGELSPGSPCPGPRVSLANGAQQLEGAERDEEQGEDLAGTQEIPDRRSGGRLGQSPGARSGVPGTSFRPPQSGASALKHQLRGHVEQLLQRQDREHDRHEREQGRDHERDENPHAERHQPHRPDVRGHLVEVGGRGEIRHRQHLVTQRAVPIQPPPLELPSHRAGQLPVGEDPADPGPAQSRSKDEERPGEEHQHERPPTPRPGA